jgi:hypothetical protein
MRICLKIFILYIEVVIRLKRWFRRIAAHRPSIIQRILIVVADHNSEFHAELSFRACICIQHAIVIHIYELGLGILIQSDWSCL